MKKEEIVRRSVVTKNEAQFNLTLKNTKSDDEVNDIHNLFNKQNIDNIIEKATSFDRMNNNDSKFITNGSRESSQRPRINW
jgi:hypothetical protein